jgi:hypothetical protein
MSWGGFPDNLHEKQDVGGIMLTRGVIMSLYTHANGGQDVKLADGTVIPWRELYSVKQIIRSNEISMANIESAIKVVSGDKKMMNLVKASQTLFKEIYPELSSVAEKVTGKKMGKLTQMYLPMMRSTGLLGDDDIMSQFDRLNSNGSFRTETDVKNRRLAYMKSRADDDKARGHLELDFRVLLNRYYVQAANYIGSAEAVRDSMAILNRPDVAEAFAARYGKESTGIYDKLRLIVERDLSHNGRTEPYQSFERVLGTVKNNAYSAFMSGNLYSVANQLLSLPAAFSMLPAMAIADAMGTFSRLMSYTFPLPRKRITGEGPKTMWEAIKKDKTYALVAKHAPHIILRTADEQIEQWLEAYSSSIGRSGIKVAGMSLEKIVEAGFRPMINVDFVVTLSTWSAAFNNEMRILSRRGLDPETAEKMAAGVANDVVRSSQNPSIYSEKGLFQTGNEFTKMFIPFSGQAFAALKFNYKNFVLPLIRGYESGGKAGLVRAAGGVLKNPATYKRALFYNVIPALFFVTLALRRPPNKEELLEAMAFYPLMSLPILGPIMWGAAVTGFASGDNTLFGSAMRGLGDITKSISEIPEDGWDWKDTGKAMRVGAQFVGLPLYPLKVSQAIVDELAKTELSNSSFRQDDPIWRTAHERFMWLKNELTE